MDWYLKKYEIEGLNVWDLLIVEFDLEFKDEFYFVEIRNFIGKVIDCELSMFVVESDNY